VQDKLLILLIILGSQTVAAQPYAELPSRNVPAQPALSGDPSEQITDESPATYQDVQAF
jgi:hypothetical protein